MVPTRVLDTRTGLGGTTAGPKGVIRLQLAGRGGIPAAGVGAVAINVTVTQPSRAGYVTVYPDGKGAPYASNLNFGAGQTVQNLVIATLGTDGAVDLYNASTGTTQLVGDVSGYYVDGTATQPGTYSPLTPARILDTRVGDGGARIAPQGTDRVQVAGRGGIPASGVSMAVLNVTVTRPAAAGYLTVYADGHPRPVVSNLDFSPSQTVPNLVFAPVGADGKVDLFNGSTGATDAIADVAGYVLSGSVTDPGAYVPLNPTRLLDTRRYLGGSPLAGRGILQLTVAGRGGVPTSSLRAVVLNLTVTGASRYGYVAAYPGGFFPPLASNVDFGAGQTVANLVVAPVSVDGKVDLYNGSTGPIQLVADVAGYYVGTYGEPAATCDAFSNSTGITDSTITIANASDISGPVPNFALAAQQGTQAYAAYFNSVSSICGRSLSVEALDTQTSSSGDQQAAATACSNAFAMVGSLSMVDDGGASTAAGCGIPDIRARPSSPARRDAPNSFAVSYGDLGAVPATVPQYFVRQWAPDVAHAAMMWLNAGSYPTEAQSEVAGWTSAGATFVYTGGIDTTMTVDSLVPILGNLERDGVRYIQFDGPPPYAVQLARAMQIVGMSAVLVVDPLGADPTYVAGTSDLTIGANSFTDAVLTTDTGNPELDLYEHWLQVVAPGATPSTQGLYAWSAAMLFTQQAQAIGGRLTRASLIASLAGVTGWTGNGLQTPEAVGAKTPAPCAAVVALYSGVWLRQTPGQFACGQLTATGIGN